MIAAVAEALQAALDRPIQGGAAEKLEHLRDRVRRAIVTLSTVPAAAAPGPYSDMGGKPDATYTVELKGPVDTELFDPNVAHDEIDEDPPELYAIDADDPDDGRNTIPVDDLAGCHVEIKALPGQAPADAPSLEEVAGELDRS